MKRLLLLLLFFLPQLLTAQEDYTWWNELHNWDGIRGWQQYLIISPAFLGPNALPVPELKNGLLPGQSTFELAAQGQYMPGDRTHNLFSRLFLRLDSDVFGVQVSMVPIEHYLMDTVIRDERKSNQRHPKGFTTGDVYVGTYVQLLKDKEKWPDLLLTINLRTASGGAHNAARYTDAPGYFFDLSFGKSFPVGGKLLRSIRPHGMMGFYVWQTNLDNFKQNDAFQYGLGCTLVAVNLEMTHLIKGYSGYIGNGDQPIVYRGVLRTRRKEAFNWSLFVQQGLRDFEYLSVSLGALFSFGKN